MLRQMPMHAARVRHAPFANTRDETLRPVTRPSPLPWMVTLVMYSAGEVSRGASNADRPTLTTVVSVLNLYSTQQGSYST